MTLSDEDMRRIEEEEYRKLARERLERTVRLEADIRTSGDQRVEVRGVGTEMYGDAKRAAKSAARATKPLANWFLIVLIGLGCLGVFVSLLWLIGLFSASCLSCPASLPCGYSRCVTRCKRRRSSCGEVTTSLLPNTISLPAHIAM